MSAVKHDRIGIAYLDGRRVRRALLAGARSVIEDQEHLNKINVYPVPDGDTGTNLALTMSAVHSALRGGRNRHAADVFTTVADAAIDGARGNSGAIVAQFFQGVSDGLAGLARVSAAEFAAAVKRGETYARDALARPVEGTVLTVIGDVADRLQQLTHRERQIDFAALLPQALHTASESLADTPRKLEVLRKAGVVDAGAAGFVTLLRGIQEFVARGAIDSASEVLADIDASAERHDDHVTAGEEMALTERYCTECMVTGENIDRRRLKEALMSMGSSLVLAGSHSKTRIHIHVNDPSDVFRVAADFGTVSATKADDMQRQQEESHRRNGRIAIMMDSAGDIPDEELERLRIHMTPVRLHFGRESYLDKVTITAEEFYSRLMTAPEHPKTSQPAPGDFRRDFQFLASHYDEVVCINVSGAASGTLQAAQTAAERSTSPDRVFVVDSASVSVGQGLLTIYAAECAAAGYSGAQIRDAVLAMRERTPIYAVIRDLTAAVRGGRVTAPLKRVADTFRLTPVLGMRAKGKLGALGVLFGRSNVVARQVRFIRRRIDPAKTYRLAVAHANCEDDARRLHAALVDAIPHLDLSLFTRVGAALGAHTGPSGMVACVQEYEPPAPRHAHQESSP